MKAGTAGLRPARAAALALCLAVAAGCAGARPRAARGESVAAWAERQLGRPYREGGRAPEAGFDCSGLAWWTHRQAGLEIPSTSEAQFRAGRKVRGSELRRGDLVFFTTVRRGPSHVGVYIGEGRFIHAPKTGRPVARERLGEAYWRARYLGARRYW